MRQEETMTNQMTVLAEKHASQRVDLSASALRKWHDRLNGPRDSSGRRLYTADLVEKIRHERSKGHYAK